jgi:hypothetical protein
MIKYILLTILVLAILLGLKAFIFVAINVIVYGGYALIIVLLILIYSYLRKR